MRSFYNLLNNIIPLSEFRQSTKKFITKLQSSHQPLVLTQNGKSAAVLLSPQDYEQLNYENELFRAIAEGEKNIAENKTIDHEILFKDLLS